MVKLVAHGAVLRCDKGTATSTLVVSPDHGVDAEGKLLATVEDYKPNVNIFPFGMCTTRANPQVAAASAANYGNLTPQPCVPVVTGAWEAGTEEFTVNNQLMVNERSRCQCLWSGTISVADGHIEKTEHHA